MEMETTLMDYSYGSSSSRTTPFRTSDIDFGDVFGGPPRRSSINDLMRYSFTDGADSVAASRRLGKTSSFRGPWVSAEQKSVFGGGVEGGSRRLGLREDFFVDIFGGSESPSSTTPRKHDRDVFCASSPGSRTLSPPWPLPPRAEGFVGLSSGPSQFSLPDKLSKSVDSPVSGSPARTSNKDAALNGTSHLHSPKISVFGFSSRSVQVHDESRNNGPQYCPSPLSQRFYLGTGDSLGPTKHEKLDDLEGDTGNTRDQTGSSQFHFSIYKWASKGIPVVMPLRRARSLRSREKGRTESWSFNERIDSRSKVSESPSATPVNIDNHSNSDEVENQSLSYLSSKVEVEAGRPVENEVISSQKQEAVVSKWNNNVEDISDRSALDDKDGRSSARSLTNWRESSEKEMNGVLQNVGRAELKPLHAFFNVKDEEKTAGNGMDLIDRKTGRMSRISEGSSINGNNIKDFKKQDELLNRKSEETKKVITEGSHTSSEDGPGRKRPKGKVKEFIKIFNQEAPPGKPITSIHPQGQSSTKKENGTSEATEEAHIHRNAAVKDRVTVSQLEKPRVHCNKVADPYKQSQNEHNTMDNNDILFSDTSFGQRYSSASSTASTTDDTRITDEDADESSSTYFSIKELPQDENEQVQPTEDREEFQAIDAKIQQWSHGKEGNIRSLLSTLQYVLWPGSGWKPIPLVDIIEGPAVRRAYQRALLCLHPDKLQQKGATSSQKYIAEQVFDIFQEAWTHFNTLGLVSP